jgi:cytochrome P450
MTDYDYKDFDSYDQSVAGEEIWKQYAALRGKCPVGHSEKYGGYYLVTGDAEVKEAATKPALFSSADGIIFPPEPHPKFVPIEYDRPEHSWWREIMSPPVSLQAVKELEPEIEAAVNACIDVFIERGSADLVQELAALIPQGMVGDIFGFTGESRRRAVELVAMFFETKGDERILEWVGAIDAFVREETAARRANPQDDYLTQLITNEHDGRMLTHEELVSLFCSFTIAGFHSTVAGIGTLLFHIGSDPALRDRLIAEPELINGAAEEAIRIAPPLQFFRRVATEDTTLGGVEIPAKADVVLCYGAAARDERTVPDPETFDPTRKINRHVGWGWGIHRCLGIGLARAEMRIVAQTVLRRMPDFAVEPGVTYGPLEGGMVMALTSLPVTFTPGHPSGAA